MSVIVRGTFDHYGGCTYQGCSYVYQPDSVFACAGGRGEGVEKAGEAMTELSEVEMNRIELRLNLCERCDLTADVFNARDIRTLLDMARRPTADSDAYTERAEQEAEDLRDKLCGAEVENDRLERENAKLRSQLEFATSFRIKTEAVK